MPTDPAPSVLVHVGFSKTGTTWLQHHLFGDDPTGPFEPLFTRAEIVDHFVVPTPLAYDPEATAQAVSARRAEHRAARSSRPAIPVISHERLIGNPHSGGFDQVAIAERLVGALPDANLLIVIREQRSMLVSLYQQYVKVGGACRMQDYCLPPDDHRLPLFRLEYLAYDEVIELYHRLFGPERVRVLTYEQFQRDPEDFVERVTTHAGAVPGSALPHDERINTGWSAAGVTVTRWANVVGRRPDSAINPRVGVMTLDRRAQRRLRTLERRLPARLGTRIALRQRALADRVCTGRFAASNRRTVELTGLNLGALGYEL